MSRIAIIALVFRGCKISTSPSTDAEGLPKMNSVSVKRVLELQDKQVQQVIVNAPIHAIFFLCFRVRVSP